MARKAILSLLLAVLAAGTTILGGQAPTLEGAAALAPADLPFDAGVQIGDAGVQVRRVASGDLDGDGNPDLVTAVSAAAEIRAWQNPGPPLSPTWTSGTVGAPGAATYSLALGDLDHDGTLDIASGSGGAAAWEVMVWRNDGTPFDGAWAGTGVGGAADVYALVTGDLDNDGDLDLVSGAQDAVITAWQNDGTPFDAAWSSNMVGNTVAATHALALGDLDNDGDLDVVSGDANQRVRVWSNDGSPFSGLWSALTALVADDVVYAVSLADLDGDGDLDIAAACGTAEDNELIVLQNDGTPFSGAWTAQDAGKLAAHPYALISDDLDVDGDPDLALGTALWSGQPEVWVWENDGFPFAHAWKGAGIGETGAIAGALANADLDRDGDPDLVSGLETGVLVAWPNLRPAEALGNWTEAPQPTPVYASLDVDVADLDHDGRADLASATDGKGIVAWRGDGGYTWERLGAMELPDVGVFAGVAFGQLNNRLELDLAAADRAEGLKAWLAWEKGTVWDDHHTGLPSTGRYEAVALGHLDHDGRLDLAAAGIGSGLGTWQGTGDPVTHWNLKATFDGTGDYCDVALGDVNHDGHLDLVGANCDGGGLPVLFNDGGFGLDKGPPPAESGSYLAVALGDLNGDGHLDVAAAPLSGGVQVWLGDGGSNWKPLDSVGPESTVLSLDRGDFDNDGYLDLLAGYKEAGVRVWKGDGGKTWTEASLNLPTSGQYDGVAFGQIDADAHLDIAAAGSNPDGVRVWTATEPPPGGWDDFLPETNPPWQWNTNQTPTCSVQVADAGSGLDVSTAQYRFSRNGGSSWEGGWLPAACTGSDGTTDPQRIAAADVPFHQDTANQNVIQFRISDLSGLTGTSPLYAVATDATPPTNPATLNSTSHTPGVWSGTSLVSVEWSDGIDATSGPWAYSYDLTTSATSLPDAVAETSGNSGSRSAGSDGQSWWFHLRTQDRALNWAPDAAHLGPFWIDVTNPGNPASLWSSTHTPYVWSSGRTVNVQWTAASDGAGSGVSAYWVSWAHAQQDDPVESSTFATSLVSPELTSASNWYFNLRTRDRVDRKASTALHLGPFYIDATPPSSSASVPGWVGRIDFDVSCTASDAHSGVSSCDLQWKDRAVGTWRSWLSGVAPGTAFTFYGTGGHTYCFRARARDNVGNLESWPAAADGDGCTEVRTDLTVTGLEVTQVVQDLANSVPLVRNKETWVRVYVESSRFDVSDVQARLSGTRGGVALPGSPLSPQFAVTAQTGGGDRGILRDAFLFFLPPDWRNGTVALSAEVNPGREVAEDSYANNSLARTVAFQATDVLCIDMVPVHLHPRTSSIGDPGFWDIVELTRRMYPISEVWIYRGSTIYPVWHDFGSNYDLPDDFDWVLSRLWWYNAWHDDPDECAATYYWGMCHPDHLSGRWGMAYVDGNEGAGVMDVSTAFNTGCTGGTARCYPYWEYPLGGMTLAHELGHNFDRRHIDCNDPDNVDHGYPYPVCQIADDTPTSYYGLAWPLGYDIGNPEIIEPTDATPLMSYGWPQWVDDYTYRALFNRLDRAVADEAPPAGGWAQAGEYLYASGLITPTTQSVFLDYFYRRSELKASLVAASSALYPEATLPYSLTLEDSQGQVLYTHPFSPTAAILEGESGLLFFGEVVPYDADTARIALHHLGQELAARMVSAHAPQVEILSPAGGEAFTDTLPISWEGHDADAGDELVYAVRYSADDGGTWETVVTGLPITSFVVTDTRPLAGSTTARVQVIASDGVNTGQATSAAFSLAQHPPEVHVSEPRDGNRFEPGETIVLRGLAIDAEDGPITDPGRLAWSSDRAGALGNGPELAVDTLPEGEHRIRLTVTDSQSASGWDEVRVLVKSLEEAIYLPLVVKGYAAP